MAIVILNAPPHSGKDTIANHLVATGEFAKREFKQGIYDIAEVVLGENYSLFQMHLASRSHKETPKDYLQGLTPREFLIKVSEEWIKPTLGEDYFGKALLRSLPEDLHTVVSDGGFNEEVLSLLKGTNPPLVIVVRMHREGYSFEGDSRNYIAFPVGTHPRLFQWTLHLKEDDPQHSVTEITELIKLLTSLSPLKVSK